MHTIFMNSENSKTSEPYVFILKLTDKLDLRRGEKIIPLSNLSIYYTWKNIKSSYNNNKFKISASTWNDKFELIWLYSISNIQDYFEYILKKHAENTDKLSVQIYGNKIKNRVKFKIKDGYSLELLTPETMKLLGSTENKIIKDKNKPFGSLLEISPTNNIFLKTFNSKFQDIKVWFTDQNSQPLEIEDRINLTLVIKWRL